MQQVETRGSSSVSGFSHPRRNVWALGIESGMHVADFGSGSGAHTISIAERLAGRGSIYAIDVQKDLLRRTLNDATRHGFNNVEVIWADLEMPRASKIGDSMLDLVLVSNILFQVADKLALLAEARRVVKAAGRVSVIDWLASFNGLGPAEEEVVEREMAIELAQKVGLTLEKEFSAGAHHYGLIFRPVSMAQ